MQYQPLIPVVDEWVLWLCCLLLPLAGMVAVTYLSILRHSFKRESENKFRLNLLIASLATFTVLGVLPFMLHSGLTIQENQRIASHNLTLKYNVESVVWENQKGAEVSPTDSLRDKVILVKDKEGQEHVARFTLDQKSSEPFLEFLPISE